MVLDTFNSLFLVFFLSKVPSKDFKGFKINGYFIFIHKRMHMWSMNFQKRNHQYKMGKG